MTEPKPPGRLRKDLRYPLPGEEALRGIGILGQRLSHDPDEARKWVFVAQEPDLGPIEAALKWFRAVSDHLAERDHEISVMKTRSFAIGIWRSRPPLVQYPSRERALGGPPPSG